MKTKKRFGLENEVSKQSRKYTMLNHVIQLHNASCPTLKRASFYCTHVRGISVYRYTGIR